jgi:hypothetical protein
MKVKMLSFLRTGRLYLQEVFQVLISVSQPQGHSAARKFMSMKNSNDPIEKPTIFRFVAQCPTQLRHRVAL